MTLLFSSSASAAARTSSNHLRQEILTTKFFSWRCAPSMLRQFTNINCLKVAKLGLRSSSSKYCRLTTMSSSATIVDHVVLFKMKPQTPVEKSEAMLEGLRGLRELDGVLELTVAPILSQWPDQASWAAGFTHALHGRYKDKASLDAYSISSAHVSVVKTKVLPIIDDLLAVDWEASVSPPGDQAFGVIRIALLKLKDGISEDDIKGLLETFTSYPGLFPSVGQVSAGPNFSPARAKGYNYGYLSQFKSVKELEELTTDPNHVTLMYNSVNPHVESFVLVDALK